MAQLFRKILCFKTLIFLYLRLLKINVFSWRLMKKYEKFFYVFLIKKYFFILMTEKINNQLNCSRDFSKFLNDELLQIISGYEAELQAKDIAIAVLKVLLNLKKFNFNTFRWKI